MLQTFLNNTCNIIEKSQVKVWWEVTITENTIYTWITCHFYNTTANYTDTWISINTKLNKIKAIIEPDKTSVKIGNILELFDSNLWNLGKYEITFVKMNRTTKWNDSIELDLTTI